MQHKSLNTLQNGFNHIQQSPSDNGTLELIVARPEIDERKVLSEGELDQVKGLIGDNWEAKRKFKN